MTATSPRRDLPSRAYQTTMTGECEKIHFLHTTTTILIININNMIVIEELECRNKYNKHDIFIIILISKVMIDNTK